MRYLTLIILVFILSISSSAFAKFGFSTTVTTLATADVRQALLASETTALDLIIQNPSANTVSIFLGGSDVTTSGSTIGIEISPGQSISLSSTQNFELSRQIPFLISSRIFIISTGTAVPVVIGIIIE